MLPAVQILNLSGYDRSVWHIKAYQILWYALSCMCKSGYNLNTVSVSQIASRKNIINTSITSNNNVLRVFLFVCFL